MTRHLPSCGYGVAGKRLATKIDNHKIGIIFPSPVTERILYRRFSDDPARLPHYWQRNRRRERV